MFSEKSSAECSELLSSLEDLCRWVARSLEMFRGELHALLYPMMVHAFMVLVRNGQTEKAHTMLQSRIPEYAAHSDELERLLPLSSLAMLERSPLAVLFCTTKYVISMSNDTFQLLYRYLNEKKAFLLLSLINEHVDVQVYSGPPKKASEHSADVGLLGLEQLGVPNINKKAILWGTVLPPEHPPLAGHPSSAPAPPAQTSTLVTFSQGKLTEAIAREDLRRCASMAPPALPSVCFFTFFNSGGNINSLTFSADGSMLAAACADSSLQTWDFLPERVFFEEDAVAAAAVAASPLHRPAPPSGDAPAAAAAGAHVHHPASLRSGSPDARHSLLWGHAGPVHRADISQDMQFLLSCSEDGTARLWSVELKTAIAAYRGHQHPVWDCCFAPDNFLFATCGHDTTARVWATDRMHPVRMFAGHTSDVDCVSFHPNSAFLATGSSDRSVRLWDLQSAGCSRLLAGHGSAVSALAISPNGRLLASADYSGSIRIWDLRTGGKQLANLKGHTRAVWSLDFSQDGVALASGGADNTVRIWDMAGLPAGQPSEDAAIPRLVGASDDAAVSPLRRTFPTKWTPVVSVRWTRTNLLLAGGPFRGPPGLVVPDAMAGPAALAAPRSRTETMRV